MSKTFAQASFQAFEEVLMKRNYINSVIAEKADFVLDIQADMLKPELSGLIGELELQLNTIVDGELAQLARESADYWMLTSEVC